MIDISVIIPLRNEGENILPLALELTEVFAPRPWEWECIWVDDGSTDDTSLQIENLARLDRRHRYLIFGMQAGQSAALRAGFETARGNIICTLDGDGQNDPADLPLFIDILQSHDVDMIAGYREIRQDNWVKRLSSIVGNAFWSFVTGQTMKDTGCATRVMKKSSLMTLPFFSGMHRFLPKLFVMMGFRTVEVPARHRPRLRGHSKYGIWNRLGSGLLDCFGVLWLEKRALKYKVVKSSQTPES
jgi:dolichol-phosphate mannosyltransferase